MRLSGRHINTEEGTYEDLLDQYKQKAFSYISQKIQDNDDALDVLQNVFLHLWICRKSLNSTNTSNIIITTCNDKIAEFYRASKKRPDNQTLFFDHADTSFEDLDLHEYKEHLLIELEESIALIIPPLRRKIFKMNKLEGITQKQIALRLNMPLRTVEDHIFKAFAFLKNRGNNS